MNLLPHCRSGWRANATTWPTRFHPDRGEYFAYGFHSCAPRLLRLQRLAGYGDRGLFLCPEGMYGVLMFGFTWP